MSFFKKITLTLAFVAGFLSPAMALADSYGIDAAATAAKLPKQVAGQSTVTGVVGSVVSVALSMISIVFFILILYAGFNWMIARGNTEAVEKSKGIIEGAVIGLIIVMAAYAITRFVFSSLDSGAPEAAAPTASSPASATQEPAQCCITYSGGEIGSCTAVPRDQCAAAGTSAGVWFAQPCSDYVCPN